MPIFENEIVGYPIDNNNFPMESGPQCIPVTVGWDEEDSYTLDLRTARDKNEFGSIQSVFIDNRLNETDVILRCLSTGHEIVCPSGAQITSPVFGKEPLYTVKSFSLNTNTALGTIGFRTKFYFLNIFQPLSIIPYTPMRISPINDILIAATGIISISTFVEPNTIITGWDLSLAPAIGSVAPYAANSVFTLQSSVVSIIRPLSNIQASIFGATLPEVVPTKWEGSGYFVGAGSTRIRVSASPLLPFDVRITGSLYYQTL